MKKYRWLAAILVLLLASLACQTLTGGGIPPTSEFPSVATAEVSTESPPLPENPSGNNNDNNSSSVDSELFPVPSDAENVIEMGNDAVIFQTRMSLNDAMDFYRDAYGKQGYTERDLLTVTTDQTFSMVFDGHSSGKAIAVQGVDLGDGSINISITLQDI
jgi:hypothetical protein